MTKKQLEDMDKEQLEKEKLDQEIKLLKKEFKNFDHKGAKKNRSILILTLFITSIPAIALAMVASLTLFNNNKDLKMKADKNSFEYVNKYEELKRDYRSTSKHKITILTLVTKTYPSYKDELDTLNKHINDNVGFVTNGIIENSNRENVIDSFIKGGEDTATISKLSKTDNYDNLSTNSIVIKFKSSDSIPIDEKKEINSIDDTSLKNKLNNALLIDSVKVYTEKQKIIAETKEKLRSRDAAPLFEEQYWVKQGYYIDTKAGGESLKIYLVNLNKNKKTCKLLLKDGDNKMNFELSATNKIYEYTGKRYKYTFIYSNIGTAGKNPFKKALYFTFQRYNKTQ